jgi:uncharacterized protein (TIGR01244 family)
MHQLRSIACAVVVGLIPVALHAQQVTKATVPGVTNFAKLETTIACAGATTPEAMPELKKMGYKSVVNLRPATEQGANVPEGEAAAKAVGLTYIHIPFNAASPDPAAAETCLTEIVKPANNPAFVHCASANRAAAMWLVKRIALDKWDTTKASTEAAALGLTNAALKDWAINFAVARKP